MELPPKHPVPARLPLLGSTGGSQQPLHCRVTPRASRGLRWLTPAAYFGSTRRVAHPHRPGSAGAPGLMPPSPRADGTAAATRSGNPPKSVFHLPPRFPGRRTPPPLGAIRLVKLKSNPFDVPLPTPSQLPAKNAGDFSLSPAADKSQIVPVAPFEVADTSVWLRAPSLPGPSSGYVGNHPSPWDLGVSGIPRGPAATAPWGCPIPGCPGCLPGTLTQQGDGFLLPASSRPYLRSG